MTFHEKTYTNAFPLNGQKLMANKRLTNAFSKRSNGLVNAFNRRAEISLTFYRNVLMDSVDFLNAFSKCSNGLINAFNG